MAKHIDTGKKGEALGIAWLLSKGYILKEQNWRHARWEVDVITERNGILHFTEIKTRRSLKFGHPEDKVGEKKIRNLINAAEQYLYLNPQWQRIQFSILSILILDNQPIDYFLIEDVFL
ncbi:MAG: YraN family protein [Ferruginibacter sp.]|nr:YraN family protein [Ferruginibacter sp.]